MLRIRLFFHELFMYKLPNLWSKIKDKFNRNPIGMIALSIFLMLGIPSAIYYGVQYNHYQQAVAQQKKLANAPYDQNGIMRITKAGPMAYLRLELGVKTDAQVKKLFDNNIKYQGKLNEIIANTSKFTKDSQYQDYLNPIIDEVLSGQTISGEKTGIKFATESVDVTQNDAVSGVMMIAIDSSKPEQVQQAQKYMSQKRDYKVMFYDIHTKAGFNLFDGARQQYLFSGEYERTGFNNENDWNGVMYAFNNGRWVFRSKTFVNQLPKELSNSSLNKTDEYQFKHVYNNQ